MIGLLIGWGIVMGMFVLYYILEESPRGREWLDKQARRVER